MSLREDILTANHCIKNINFGFMICEWGLSMQNDNISCTCIWNEKHSYPGFEFFKSLLKLPIVEWNLLPLFIYTGGWFAFVLLMG